MVLAGASFAFSYHLCNGIRHLVWDAGIGFEKQTAFRSGMVVLFGSAVLTLAIWVLAYQLRG